MSGTRSQGALAEAGIAEPTPVQLEAIPQILSGSDVAVQSYTGSGKVSDGTPWTAAHRMVAYGQFNRTASHGDC